MTNEILSAISEALVQCNYAPLPDLDAVAVLRIEERIVGILQAVCRAVEDDIRAEALTGAETLAGEALGLLREANIAVSSAAWGKRLKPGEADQVRSKIESATAKLNAIIGG